MYRPSNELRSLRLEYAKEINSDSPDYEKICELWEKIAKMGCRVSKQIAPDRYKPCQTS